MDEILEQLEACSASPHLICLWQVVEVDGKRSIKFDWLSESFEVADLEPSVEMLRDSLAARWPEGFGLDDLPETDEGG